MAEAKASVLVIEAEKTIIFDRREMIAAANEKAISIVCR
jgi:DUF1009 family protein